MPSSAIPLTEAVELTRTGDIWLFRGTAAADRAIHLTTNAPVNHVGMAMSLDDLPPLMWHAELGRSLPDMWAGTHRRGAQLHVLADAVRVWAHKYGQRAWLRQLQPDVSAEMEDAALRTVARLDGTPFPSTAKLATGFVRARFQSKARPQSDEFETAFCAEIVATTYQAMGLLPAHRSASRYDPGSFWSGDGLALLGGSRLGDEIEVDVGPPT